MKFSADVNHNFVVNWWKYFGCSTTHKSVTPLFVSKLCKGLAPILFEIFSKEFFWWGSRPISVTQWQEFQISPKKWRFEIFRTSAVSRGNRVIHVLIDILSWISVLGEIYSNLINVLPQINAVERHFFSIVVFWPNFCNVCSLFWWFSACIEIIS